MDFHKIPELSDLELKDFKRIFHEYQQARHGLHDREKSEKRIHPSTGELFGDFAGMMNGGPDGFFFENEEEEEWEEGEEDDEEESEEITEEMDYLLDDGFEEIDEDI